MGTGWRHFCGGCWVGGYRVSFARRGVSDSSCRFSWGSFDFLGGVGDAGSGIFYALAGVLEKSGADVSRAAGDYGTRFIAAAGVANFLCAADAYEIAGGRKE